MPLPRPYSVLFDAAGRETIDKQTRPPQKNFQAASTNSIFIHHLDTWAGLRKFSLSFSLRPLVLSQGEDEEEENRVLKKSSLTRKMPCPYDLTFFYVGPLIISSPSISSLSEVCSSNHFSDGLSRTGGALANSEAENRKWERPGEKMISLQWDVFLF